MNTPFYNQSDNPVIEKKLQDILEQLFQLYSKEIELSLDRLLTFLEKLGNPHLKLSPVIHIAGTNGKGSTFATLRSLLEASDKTVHVYTSPHLIHPTERIILAGCPISSEELISVLEECISTNDGSPITFFEIFTAAAFLIMSRSDADYTLLETGMGGRYDATNVIPNPLCTIINTISFDHKEFLGDTIKKIASEKVGIMKAGVPCVIGKQIYEEAYDVFQNVGQNLNSEAPLLQYGLDWTIQKQDEQNILTIDNEDFVIPQPNLVGEHQLYNVGAACTAYKMIMGEDFKTDIFSENHSQKPLQRIKWPGRLQRLKDTQWNTLTDPSNEIWIDGGHNDSAGQALATQAAIWKNGGKSLILILAMVNRKNPKEFLDPLIPYIDEIIVTEIPDEKDSFAFEELYREIKDYPVKVNKSSSPQKALSSVKSSESRILMTGSLYFMGHILTNRILP
ncbi:MAG: folylpolyglutamate synthase/dihydrofolate synthase family protein [Pseudomonadota bacterium]